MPAGSSAVEPSRPRPEGLSGFRRASSGSLPILPSGRFTERARRRSVAHAGRGTGSPVPIAPGPFGVAENPWQEGARWHASRRSPCARRRACGCACARPATARPATPPRLYWSRGSSTSTRCPRSTASCAAVSGPFYERQHLLLDLEGVTFADSSFIGFLVQLVVGAAARPPRAGADAAGRPGAERALARGSAQPRARLRDRSRRRELAVAQRGPADPAAVQRGDAL